MVTRTDLPTGDQTAAFYLFIYSIIIFNVFGLITLVIELCYLNQYPILRIIHFVLKLIFSYWIIKISQITQKTYTKTLYYINQCKIIYSFTLFLLRKIWVYYRTIIKCIYFGANTVMKFPIYSYFTTVTTHIGAFISLVFINATFTNNKINYMYRELVCRISCYAVIYKIYKIFSSSLKNVK